MPARRSEQLAEIIREQELRDQQQFLIENTGSDNEPDPNVEPTFDSDGERTDSAPVYEIEHRTEFLADDREITLTAQERKDLVDLLHSAASINRDYLRRLPNDRRGNPTEDYVGRFTTAATRLEAK